MFVAGFVAGIHHGTMAPTVSDSPRAPFPRTGAGVTAGGLSGQVGADFMGPVVSSFAVGPDA